MNQGRRATVWLAIARTGARWCCRTLPSQGQHFKRTSSTLGSIRWTAEEDARVKALIAEGQSYRTIRQHFSERSALAIRDRAYRLKSGKVISRPCQERVRWSAAEDLQLEDLRKRGLTHEQCKKHMPGRSQVSIERRWKDVVQPSAQSASTANANKPWGVKEVIELVTMREKDHLSFGTIASKLQRSIVSVRRSYARHTDPAVRPKVLLESAYTPADDEKIASLLASGHSHSNIAQTLGRSVHSVRSHIALHGDIFGARQYKTRTSQQLRRRVVEARERGASRKEILEQYSEIPRSTLHGLIYRGSTTRPETVSGILRPGGETLGLPKP